jgi:hypothetical protein
MAEFTLDTSGSVRNTDPLPFARIVWEDLTPFAQGYVEAMFADFRANLTRAEERKRPLCTLKDGQIWLLKCGRQGFSRATLRVPHTGHGSTATNSMCAGLIRRGWLADGANGIVRITEAGERALRTAMPLGFSDLAPEALALILERCTDATVGTSHREAIGAVSAREERLRGSGLWKRSFLTPFLREDGRVDFKERAQ